MIYEYECRNKNCKNYKIKKEVDIKLSEYSEDKLPKCECKSKTFRIFSISGHQTFGDGYKG